MPLPSPVEKRSPLKFVTRGHWDPWNPLAILGLSAIGVAFIYSAQLSEHGNNWLQQVAFLGIGLTLYLVVSLVDYRYWLSVTHWFYAACLIPLLLVLTPIGSARYGAQRWISFGPISLQPSEPAKVAVLIMVAAILIRSDVGRLRSSWGVLGKLALAVGLPMLLILLQPDLKSAIVLPPVVLSMLFISKLSKRFFLGVLGALALIVGVVTWDVWRYANFMEANNYSFLADRGKYEPHSWLPYLHDYQRNRVLSFVAPEKIDSRGTDSLWNLNQSLISVASGGLTGKGWTQGTQAQLGYLPRAVAHNDFIFSVIAEEKGFLGSLTVLSLFGIVLFNGVRIAGLARDRLGSLLAIGVTVLFAVHVFVNIAMTIGLVPITGIPLPFISYGGSFVLSCCLLQGLVQSVYRFRKDFA